MIGVQLARVRDPFLDGAIRVRVSEQTTAGQVNAALVRAGVEVSALVPEQDSLEDVFVAR